ncbi:ribbon-helix-helix domain-containing protein [uncultured Parasutterella sp.]|uniref:ribbon-helix-helix domain-containing protein n=1 Tax=uncultured Parasutterella sp. TaxID=1263098 RepID=UPI0025936C6B|nr:ribbon-helix-helix domain-containing protein [uncultured Parasutterella sp.]
MGRAEWSVTVSEELNDAAMAYLAKSGEGVEGLSNLVENAVGKYVQDPRAIDKESDVTEGELNDLINAAVEKTKEKYSSLTEGELRDIINVAVQKTKEKYTGITAGQFNDMINSGIDAVKRAMK